MPTVEGTRKFSPGDIVTHKLTEESVLILQCIDPDSRDQAIKSNWYLVRCGKATGDLAEQDYARKKFCELELKESPKEVSAA